MSGDRSSQKMHDYFSVSQQCRYLQEIITVYLDKRIK